jgi:hypothetical protein
MRDRELKSAINQQNQRDLWQQTIESGRAVQQAAEVQKAPEQTKQTENQREA